MAHIDRERLKAQFIEAGWIECPEDTFTLTDGNIRQMVTLKEDGMVLTNDETMADALHVLGLDVCAICGEGDTDFDQCVSCGRSVCSECCDWCHEPDDELNGEYFCEDCQTDVDEAERW